MHGTGLEGIRSAAAGLLKEGPVKQPWTNEQGFCSPGPLQYKQVREGHVKSQNHRYAGNEKLHLLTENLQPRHLHVTCVAYHPCARTGVGGNLRSGASRLHDGSTKHPGHHNPDTPCLSYMPISWGGARGVNGAAVLWQSECPTNPRAPVVPSFRRWDWGGWEGPDT